MSHSRNRITKKKPQARLAAEAEPMAARYFDLKVEYDIARAAGRHRAASSS
jgi:hypothetical protein